MKTGRLVDCAIDCKVNYTVNAQKSMKSIVRMVHLPSVVQSEFNEATRTPFLHKENKNNNFIHKFFSSAQHSAILESIRWMQAAYAVLFRCCFCFLCAEKVISSLKLKCSLVSWPLYRDTYRIVTLLVIHSTNTVSSQKGVYPSHFCSQFSIFKDNTIDMKLGYILE